ncbi:hypothetical protein ACFYKT_09500 [Cytobacillus sp. FJAT-53684]|uniref:DUF3953 domain-containing protein n=1 Tax=Cytobacillus mangrovibacter TaxID=3299024 RepID=A0ABW6K0R0_9BACI
MLNQTPIWLRVFVVILLILSTYFLINGNSKLMFVTSQLLLFTASVTKVYFGSKTKDKNYNFYLVMTVIFGLSFITGIFFL